MNSAIKSRLARYTLQLGECDLCASTELQQPLICQYCLADLPLFNYQLLDNNLLNWPAINTLFANNKFEQLFCLAPYVWPFDYWLKQYKYQSRFELAQLFSSFLESLWHKQMQHLHQQNLNSLHISITVVPVVMTSSNNITCSGKDSTEEQILKAFFKLTRRSLPVCPTWVLLELVLVNKLWLYFTPIFFVKFCATKCA